MENMFMKKIIFILTVFIGLISFSCQTESNDDNIKLMLMLNEIQKTSKNNEDSTNIPTNKFDVNYYFKDTLLYTESVENYAIYGKNFIPTVDDFYEFAYWYYDDEDVAFDFDNIVITDSINLHAKEVATKYNFIYGFNRVLVQYTIEEIEDFITNDIDDLCVNPFSIYDYMDNNDFEYTFYYANSFNDIYKHHNVNTTMIEYKKYIKNHDMVNDSLYFLVNINSKTYNIGYNLNDGSINDLNYRTSFDATQLNNNKCITLPTNVTKKGDIAHSYTFDGWYYDNVKVTEINKDNYKNYRNVTFNAKFNETVYYTTVNFYDDDRTSLIDTKTIVKGTSVSKINNADPSETKKFVGWVDSNNNDFDFTKSLTDDEVNIYAKYKVYSVINILEKDFLCEYFSYNNRIIVSVSKTDYYVRFILNTDYCNSNEGSKYSVSDISFNTMNGAIVDESEIKIENNQISYPVTRNVGEVKIEYVTANEVFEQVKISLAIYNITLVD